MTYELFPPLSILRKCLVCAPRCAVLLIYLWENKKASNQCWIYKKNIKKNLNISETLLKNQLHELKKHHLIEDNSASKNSLWYIAKVVGDVQPT